MVPGGRVDRPRNPAFPLRVRLIGSKFVVLKLIALLFADQVQLGGVFWSPG